jgi:hypothetical protein
MRSRIVATVVLSTAGAFALSAPAHATPLPGENGRIVLVSYQNFGQARAELFLLPVPSSTGGGTLSAPIATSATERHRHPTWSPDRTKIAYARGVSGGNYDIFVQDLTQPLSSGTNPKNITQSPGSNDDRPAWAPNGNYIAFERDSGVPADRDIVVSLTNGGGQTNITNTVGAIEGKPAWDPTSSTIYYEKGNAQNPSVNTDIVKRSISFPGSVPTVGPETLAVADNANHPEIQPAISPDGSKICYGTGYPGAPSTDIKVAPLTSSPATGSKVSLSTTAYYCTWSPDGTMVAFTAGAGSAGDLVMVRADGSSLSEIPLATGSDIQTNADWAPDGRPECPDSTATATTGHTVTIPVECTDTGPEYERTEVREYISQQPQHGTATQDLAGDPIRYEPDAGFTGTDSIEIGSFDEFGFGSDKGTIAITVTNECFGKKPTIIGTDGDDTLEGSTGKDVIVTLGGKDSVKGRAGKDRICTDGAKDELAGGKGDDRLEGGKRKDICKGGKGDDTAKHCEITHGVP